MPRPKKYRTIGLPPQIIGFKPFGSVTKSFDVIFILFEEYEALKLADYVNLNHDEAATKMNVSRPTFSRIYENARKKVAKAFVEAKNIAIKGGNVKFEKEWLKCGNCNIIVEKNSEYLNCNNCSSENLQNITEDLNLNINHKNKIA